jgi:membrane fusion protein, multidrug efflux system
MSVRILLSLLAVVGIVAACGGEAEPAEKQLATLRAERAAIDEKIRALERAGHGEKKEATPVTVHTTAVAPFEHILDVKGTVESRTTVTITPKMAGMITKLAVVNGQSVSKGQLLVEIDNAMIKAGLDEVQTQLDLAATLYDKQKRIYEQKAGSEVQYLTAKTQKEALERRLTSLKEQLEMSRIYAPVSGIVENVTPRVGETAMPGMPMFTIVNTADMRVVADLAETYVKDVQTGDKVTLIFPEIGDTIISRVLTAARSVNPVSRTFRVEAQVRPVPAAVRPNMTASVIINDKTVKDAITVPLVSVVREGTNAHVYVVNAQGRIERRDVTMGLVTDGMIQVVSGLQAGERVVVRGVLDVVAGQTVRVIQ